METDSAKIPVLAQYRAGMQVIIIDIFVIKHGPYNLFLYFTNGSRINVYKTINSYKSKP